LKHCISITTLIDYIGQGPAGRLTQALGGQSIKIPKRQAGRTWAQLVQIMGEAAAATLCEHFGSESLYIARDHRSALNQRRADVAALRAQGLSFAQISTRLKYTTTYTERGVRRLVESPPKDSAARHTTADALTNAAQRALFDAPPAAHPLMAMFGLHDTIPTDKTEASLQD